MTEPPAGQRRGGPLIGRRPRFIFVHIPKAAGNSVRDALGPHTRDPNPLRRLAVRKLGWPAHPAGLHAHSTALEYRRALGRAYDRHFVFSFVRNPFAWIVSAYHYIGARPHHPAHARFAGMDFNAYVAHRCARAAEGHTQSSYLTDTTGASLVDYVGRVETIAEGIGEVNARLGTRAEIGHVNRSRHDAVAQHYTPGSAAKVAEAFAIDFETFGYDRVPPGS